MEKEKLKAKLRSSELSENEVEIYLTLIDYGISKIGRIVKITGLQKSSCYNAINSMMHKGIISSVSIGKVAYYQAEDPLKIIDYIDEKKKIIENLLPELRKRFKLKKTESSVKHFKGIKGVKAVFFDILREGKNNDVFGSEGQLSDRLPVFTKQYIRRLNELKLKTRNLIGIRGKRPYSKGTTFRYVNKEVKSNVVTNIYADKIGIIIWKDEPEAIIIEDKIAANSYRSYFEFMWKNSSKSLAKFKKK